MTVRENQLLRAIWDNDPVEVAYTATPGVSTELEPGLYYLDAETAVHFKQGSSDVEASAVAASSTVTLTLTGTDTTVVPGGSKASDGATEFALDGDVTLAALTAWAALTLYAEGDRRTNSGNSYVCITAGTSAASGGPTTTSADITDGTAHWRYLGAGAAAVDGAATAVLTGPREAAAFTVTTIVDAVAGWSNVTNLLAATAGVSRSNYLVAGGVVKLLVPDSGAPAYVSVVRAGTTSGSAYLNKASAG